MIVLLASTSDKCLKFKCWLHRTLCVMCFRMQEMFSSLLKCPVNVHVVSVCLVAVLSSAPEKPGTQQLCMQGVRKPHVQRIHTSVQTAFNTAWELTREPQHHPLLHSSAWSTSRDSCEFLPAFALFCSSNAALLVQCHSESIAHARGPAQGLLQPRNNWAVFYGLCILRLWEMAPLNKSFIHLEWLPEREVGSWIAQDRLPIMHFKKATN